MNPLAMHCKRTLIIIIKRRILVVIIRNRNRQPVTPVFNVGASR